jgi:hypothetical protein
LKDAPRGYIPLDLDAAPHRARLVRPDSRRTAPQAVAGCLEEGLLQHPELEIIHIVRIVVVAHAGRGESIKGLEVDANAARASQGNQGHDPRVGNRHLCGTTVLHQRRRAAMPV